MSLLTPWNGFFLLVALIPPLLLLYFLKLRRRTVPMSSTLLWRSVTADLQANAPFQRLRRNILLMLQMIVLLLIALSIMQPRLEGRGGSGVRSVLLIDRSGSMETTDVGEGSRLEEAQRRARATIDRLHPGGLFAGGGGETMVVAFGQSAEILQPFTDSRSQLLAAIDRIEPTHGRSNLGAALQLARVYSINTDPDNPEITQVVPADLELFSDGRIADLEEQVLRGEQLTYHRIGAPETGNQAVLQLAADRVWDRPAAIEIFASLGNFSPDPVTLDVQLSVDGVARSVQEVSLPAGRREGQREVPGQRSLVFSPFDLTRGAVIEVAILVEDGLETDNTASLIVPPPRQLRVALVTNDRQLLPRVLDGLGLGELQRFSPSQWRRARGDDAWDVVIFDAVSPDELPVVPTLTLASAPPTPRLRPYGREDGGQVALSADARHPVMQYVDTETLYVQESESILPGDDVSVILAGSKTPLVFAWEDEGHPRVHVAFDPAESTWPFEAGFVAFLYNVVDWLGHHDEALVQGQAQPGDQLAFQSGTPGGNTSLRRPDGSIRRLTAREDGTVIWGPVELAGLHVLTDDQGATVDGGRRAVRFPATPESAVSATTSIILGQDEVRAVEDGGQRYVAIWPWALGVSLLILMLEWWIWSRRVGGGRPAPGSSRPRRSASRGLIH